MGLLFDMSAMQHPEGIRHGGGEYSTVVLRALLKKWSANTIVAFVRDDWPAPPDISDILEQRNLKIVGGHTFAKISSIAQKHKCKHFFSGVPYHLHGVDLSLCTTTLTVHGLRPLEVPYDGQEWRYRKSIKEKLKWAGKAVFTERYRASRLGEMQNILNLPSKGRTIITPSYHSQSALQDWLQPDGLVDVKVLYSPITITQQTPAPDNAIDLVSKYGLVDQQYFLLISGGRWEKNSARAIKAISQLIDEMPWLSRFKIAVAGGLPHHLGKRLRRNVIALPYVSTGALTSLFKCCFGFCYPTLNEGFGYGPLEAMAQGAPVLCSATSSTTEICGDAAYFFDPRNEAEIRARIIDLLLNPQRRASLILAGKKRLRVVRKRQQEDLGILVDHLSEASGQR